MPMKTYCSLMLNICPSKIFSPVTTPPSLHILHNLITPIYLLSNMSYCSFSTVLLMPSLGPQTADQKDKIPGNYRGKYFWLSLRKEFEIELSKGRY